MGKKFDAARRWLAIETLKAAYKHLLDQFGATAWALVVGAVTLYLNEFFGLIKSLTQDPLRTAGILMIVALCLQVFSTLARVSYIHVKNKRLLLRTGIAEVWPYSDRDTRAAEWTHLSTRIQASHNISSLRIAGLTGWTTFGSKDSPLHDAIDGFNGEIRILLMNPESKDFAHRAYLLGVHEERFADEVRQTISYCAGLRAHRKDIEVRLYDDMPVWKMVLTNDFLWLQHYNSKAHVDETPVYCLTATSDGCLFSPFTNVWKKRWSCPSNKSIDLDAPNILERIGMVRTPVPHSRSTL